MSVYAVAAIDGSGNEGARTRIAAVPPPDDHRRTDGAEVR